jgi:[acyl-carrier-protein] S-malonyltransferase
MVFPGQGSQSVGMLSSLAEASAVVGETFASASDVLGYDLWQRVQDGPAETLNQTACTQPAMLTAGVAIWRCWQQQGGPMPALMAGHSLGEYTALVCAGAIDFTDAVALVERRGACMQEAVPEGTGAMAAILGLADDQVVALCGAAAGDEVVTAVNFNSPGQVVIAGNSAAVERAIALAKAAGAKRALPLPVSVPSHCSLMQPAAEAFARHLAAVEIRQPVIEVLHNVDAASRGDVASIRDALSRQLYSAVQWVETIHTMGSRGITTVLEMGPGKVLAGLSKRIDKSMRALAVQAPNDLDTALQACSPAAVE